MMRRVDVAYRRRPAAASSIAVLVAALALLSTGCTSAPSEVSSMLVQATPPAGTPTTAKPTVHSAGTPQPTTDTRASATTITTSRRPPTSTPASASRTAARTGITTVTRIVQGTTITVTVAAPRATAEPAPTDGGCPYLGADVVSEITGQHHGQTQVVQLAPHPMCVFYRSDGGRMGTVRIIQASSAAAAAAAVDQHVPVGGSQPATQPAGWSGGSRTSPGQMTQDSAAMSVYAVSKGNIAVVAEENESPSLKARVMAVCAIYGLGLEAGPVPDYCTVGGQ